MYLFDLSGNLPSFNIKGKTALMNLCLFLDILVSIVVYNGVVVVRIIKVTYEWLIETIIIVKEKRNRWNK